MRRMPNRAAPLGTEMGTGERIKMSLARLSEHVDVMGPTGSGKTQGVMLPLWKTFAPMPDVSVIAVTCKGGFASMCRDWAIAHGLTDMLVTFNPANRPLVGFNPLRKNGWPAERHAKIARTSMLAARGQHSLDDTPQLARLLFLALAVALEQELSLIDAARLLRSGRSAFRSDMIRAVQSDFLRESLEWFDALKDLRQEELAASTVARLENFVGEPLIREILTEREHALDIGDVIRNRKKLCIDVQLYNPLVPDDAKTMLRLAINNVLAHKFSTPLDEQTPTILLLDEVQEYATEDLATALTLGRELKLCVVMAHQFPSQLKLSAEDSHLFEAVQHCCRTKVVFGGMHVAELEPIVKELMIDQWDWKTIKDELTSLELNPMEVTRETVTKGYSMGGSLGLSGGTSSATAVSRGQGSSRQWGASHSHSDAFSMVHSSATNAGVSMGESVLPNGDTIAVEHNIQGNTEVDASGTTTTDTYGEFQSKGVQESSSKTKIEGTQRTVSGSINGSWNHSSSRGPWYEYIKRWRVSSRTFQTLEEFLARALQLIKAQPRAHFLVKVPDHKAIFVRADFVSEPWIPEALRDRALEHMRQSLRAAVSPPLKPPRAHTYQLSAPAVELADPPTNFGE